MRSMAVRIRNLLLLSAGILVIALILYMLAKIGYPFPCVFRKTTGLNCPGCGNTRAVLALLRLDLHEMIRMNLLFPAEIGYLIWVCFYSARLYLKTGRISIGSGHSVLDWSFLIALIIWWIVRNVLHI